MAQYSKIMEGYFTSTGVAKVLNLPAIPDSIEIWNKTAFTTPANHAVTYSTSWSNEAAGVAYSFVGNATPVTTSNKITTGGFTFFSAGTYSYGPTLTITGIVAATGVVTTSAAHNLVVGDVVLLTNTTGELQIAGTTTSVTAVPSTTTFTIGNIPTAGFAANATAGFAKKLLYADLYVPFGVIITNVQTAAAASITGVPTLQSVVSTSVNHSFVPGQEVFFVFPQINSPPTIWGMQQLDSLFVQTSTGIPQQAYVTQTAANNSNLAANQFVINIDVTPFTAFAYPTSAQAALGITFPQVLAIGDQNSGGTQIPPVTPPITIPGAWYANTRQGVIIGIGDGTTVLHANTNLVRWRAIFPDMLLTS